MLYTENTMSSLLLPITLSAMVSLVQEYTKNTSNIEHFCKVETGEVCMCEQV